MKKLLFAIILIIPLSACSKHYTLDECINKVEEHYNIDKMNLTEQERKQVDLGVYLLCTETKNNPDEAIKAIEGQK